MRQQKRRLERLEAGNMPRPLLVAIAPASMRDAEQKAAVAKLAEAEGITDYDPLIVSQSHPPISAPKIQYFRDAEEFFGFIARNTRRIGPDARGPCPHGEPVMGQHAPEEPTK